MMFLLVNALSSSLEWRYEYSQPLGRCLCESEVEAIIDLCDLVAHTIWLVSLFPHVLRPG